MKPTTLQIDTSKIVNMRKFFENSNGEVEPLFSEKDLEKMKWEEKYLPTIAFATQTIGYILAIIAMAH